MLLAEWGLGDFLWSLLVIFFMVVYFMMLFRIIMDLFSDPETSGVAKAIWVLALLFLPLITMLIYLVVRGRSMNERALAQAEQMQKQQEAYIRNVAATSGPSPTQQIADAKALLDQGTISQAEFDAIKSKALAGS